MPFLALVAALMKVCDPHNVPLATNPATAELILHSLRNAKEAPG